MRALLRYSRAECRFAGTSSIVQPEITQPPVLRTSTNTHISHSCESVVVTFVQSNERIRQGHNVRARARQTFQGKIETETGECKEEKDSPFFSSSLLKERNHRKEREPAKDAPMTLFPPSATSLGALTLTAVVFCSRLFIYTRSGRIARDVQAGGDGQRQGLPTLVANGGGTD